MTVGFNFLSRIYIVSADFVHILVICNYYMYILTLYQYHSHMQV